MSELSETSLVGRRWQAVVNGRKALNGERYAVTLTGDVAAAGTGVSVYDFLTDLACHLEEVNKEMEYPDSLQVTLFPAQGAGEAVTKGGVDA